MFRAEAGKGNGGVSVAGSVLEETGEGRGEGEERGSTREGGREGGRGARFALDVWKLPPPPPPSSE